MKTLKNLIVLLAIATITVSAKSQVKIGHINSQELLSLMPETDSAQKKLEEIAKQNELALEEMSVEFNKKYDDYVQKLNDTENPMSDLIRASKEAELQQMQERIQAFQQNAQQEHQKRQMELLQPIQKKALDAVNLVAEENKFTYILDSGMGVVVYSGANSEDILPLVKKKLGLE